MAAPLWSRLLFYASRALSSADVAQQVLRDELLFAYMHPNQRGALTSAAYALNGDYIPGGAIFGAGLFPWEKALLENPRVPNSGRVLVAAAGGGREVAALLARGYDVYAFEPVEPFLESARRVVQGSGSRVVGASYADLVERAAGRDGGPLRDCTGPFDLCLLGWGSLSHLTEPGVVVQVLQGLRVLAPCAPVITSFMLRRGEAEATNGGARKLRRVVRRVLQSVGGRATPPGLSFLNFAGFLYSFSQEELFELCRQAGYAVHYFSDRDYPHALLLPLASSGGAGS